MPAFKASSAIVSAQQTGSGASPYTPGAGRPSTFQTSQYPRGNGGATNLCALYGRTGFNPCGGNVDEECKDQILWIVIILLILAFLFFRVPDASA